MEVLFYILVTAAMVVMLAIGQGHLVIDWPLVGIVLFGWCLGLGFTAGLMHRAGRGPLRDYDTEGQDCSMDRVLVAIWPLWLPIWVMFRLATMGRTASSVPPAKRTPQDPSLIQG